MTLKPPQGEFVNSACNYNDFGAKSHQLQPLTTYNDFGNSQNINKNSNLSDVYGSYRNSTPNTLNYDNYKQSYYQLNDLDSSYMRYWSQRIAPSQPDIPPMNDENNDYFPIGFQTSSLNKYPASDVGRSSNNKHPDVDLLSDELSSVSFD